MEYEYKRIAEAIADTMFGTASAGLPVYCLPDNESRERILEIVGMQERGWNAIVQSVRSTLHLQESRTPPFRWHADSVSLHARDPLETPPALPLLVLLAEAAERMHADGDHAAHNYYARLHGLLEIPSEHQSRLENGYRQHAVELWGSLNSWLEAWEGERGIPTAYAVGRHEYIGLPMSQAVVREHDREGLREFFSLEGFAPGQRITPSDMGRAMEAYASPISSPLSSHIVRLWTNSAARERIVEAACIELESWDGYGVAHSGAGGKRPSTRLLAFLRRFPRKQISFNLLIPYGVEGSTVVRFNSGAGEVEVPAVQGPGGSTRLSHVQLVDNASLLADQLEGFFGPDEDRPVGREPRRISPLRWDDLQGGHVEVESLALGDEALLLVRHDARTRIETHLEAHARPGWAEVTELPGLPDSWIAYEHVQIVSVPPGAVHFDLAPLVPRARTSLTIRGGFRLPGLLRKWSSLEPPEVLAVAAGAEAVRLRIYDGTRIDPSLQMAESTFRGEIAVLPLAEEELADGEYLVALFIDDATTPASTALVRLRSASTPQFSVAEDDIRLVYSPESSPLWALSAGPAQWSAHVTGARAEALVPQGAASLLSCPDYRMRSPRPRPTRPPRVSVGIPVAEDSCLITGEHRTQLPPAPMPGERRTRTVVGECSTCGTVRRSAGTAWAARRRDRSGTRTSTPIEIPAVKDASAEDLRTVVDALNHVGHGTFGALERVAGQVDGSGLLADSLVRRLEVLGHIDVARDGRLATTAWAVNSASLVPTREGVHVLIGARSGVLVKRLRHLLGAGARVVESLDAGIPRIEVHGILPVALLADTDITVLAHSPVETIVNALPPLSSVANSLERVAVPKYRSAEYWDTASGSWVGTDSLVASGAYRLRDFGSIYGVRGPEDLDRGTLGIGTAQLVKHVANLWAGDPLVGYHSPSSSVVVPLGADLPSLYGRALSLCSGRPPVEIEKSRLLQYPEVPRTIADILYTKIGQ